MKQNIIKIGLGIAIIIIWGTVIYQILNGSEEEGIIIPPKKAILSETRSVESFSLLLNYRDPFLSNVSTQKASTVSKIDSSLFNLPKRILTRKPKKFVRFPLIEYKGMSKNKNRHESVALVNIDRKTYFLKSGDRQEEITIMNIYKDSIQVQKEGVMKTIKK